jgi:hypothetical protein
MEDKSDTCEEVMYIHRFKLAYYMTFMLMLLVVKTVLTS